MTAPSGRNLKMERKNNGFSRAGHTPFQIELGQIVWAAMKLGRIQAQCLNNGLTWAAFYTEKVKLDEMRVEFEMVFKAVEAKKSNPKDKVVDHESKAKSKAKGCTCETSDCCLVHGASGSP